MNNVIILLAVFGLVHFFKESDLLSKIRIFLLSLHPLFYQLLNCYFCLGFWISLIVYPLTHLHSYHPGEHFLFGFAGATVSFTISAIIYSFRNAPAPLPPETPKKKDSQ